MKRFVMPLLALTLMPAAAHAQEVTAQVQVGVPATPPPPPVQAPPQPVYVQPAPVYAQQPVYAQPGYPQPVYAQPGYGYGARRMQVVPYNGGPIPPGAQLRTRRHTGLIVGGAVLLGVPWLVSALVAAACTGSGSTCGNAVWMYAPVVGPFITAATTRDPGVVSLLVLDGILQAGGAVMLVLGAALTQQELVLYGEERHQPTGPRFAVVPMAPGAEAGVSLSISHF